MRSFLNRVGRRKFLTPIYRSMKNKGPEGLEMARNIYAEAKKGYHTVAIETLDELLK